MMSCETVQDSLDALRDGSLGLPEAGEVREHLAACRSCAREWEVTEALRAVIRDRASAPTAPVGFHVAMARLLERHVAPGGWFASLQDAFHRQPIAAMAFAAAMVLFVLVPLNLHRLSQRETILPLVEESVNEHIRLALHETPPEIPVAELHPLHVRHQRRIELFQSLSFPDDQEYRLAGGQVSYLLNRKVLDVTYYRQANRPITLLVLPSAGIRLPDQRLNVVGYVVYQAVHRGFQTVHWQEGPLIYSLVFGVDESDPSPLIEKLHHK